MKKPKLVLKFEKPTQGLWDSGAKQGGEFRPTLLQDSQGSYVKWGCWELNFWFTIGFGRSWKHAATIAQKYLARICKLPCSVKVEWEDVIESEADSEILIVNRQFIDK